jgi:adenylate cyclase
VPPPAKDHTFLFADLAGFTALTEAMGDEEAADLAGEFCDAVHELAPRYSAEAIKTIGDALMLRGDDAGQAILLGLHVVNEIGGRHYWPTVRVGMHTGPAAERGGAWFGTTVNVATRVSGVAGRGEVLLTEATSGGGPSMHGALSFLLILACPLGMALMGAGAWAAGKLNRGGRHD